jgi:hypothetical protein
MRAWTKQGYLDALRFAAQAHAGQTVPGPNLPYVIYVASVVMEVVAAVREQRGV